MKVCVCGYGVVGEGVVDILDRDHDNRVKYIFTRECLEDTRHTHDFQKVLEDDEVKVIVETMGGLDPAYQMIQDALKSKKHVVTSNKELVEKYGAICHELAVENNVSFLFEASVGGGIPLISTMRHGLIHEEIESIEGILNGTSNYILTKMRTDNLSFEAALKEAQDKGFAEKDPTDDIKGLDAGRKISILASILEKQRVDFNDVEILGIDHLDEKAMAYAKDNNLRIRLLAKVLRKDDSFSISVMPTLLDATHPLYHVDGVNNAVLFRGKDVGEVLVQGAGAGRYPTASAVVADVFACLSPYLPRTSWKNEVLKPKKSKYKVLDLNSFKEEIIEELHHGEYLAIERGN